MWVVMCVVMCVVAVLSVPREGGAQAEGLLPIPACPPAALQAGRCHLTEVRSQSEYHAVVAGYKVVIRYSIPNQYQITCGGGVGLDNEALPRFASAQEVAAVTVDDCVAPSGASYAAALAALGIALSGSDSEGDFKNLTIKGRSPNQFPAEAHHLIGLEALWRLTINNRGKARPEITPQLLMGRLASLRAMRLVNVALLPVADSLLALPPALLELHLVKVGVSQIPAKVLTRLQRLNVLLVDEQDDDGILVNVGGAPTLRVLELRASRGPVRLDGPMPPHLAQLQLKWGRQVDPPAPPSWPQRCPLEKLDLTQGLSGKRNVTKNKVVHEGTLQIAQWVNGCSQLTTLTVSAPLDTVPASLLKDLQQLQSLTLSKCALESLPNRLLNPASGLQIVDVSHNRLRELPADLFKALGSLRSLNLSHNNLSAGATVPVGSVTSLRELILSHNPLDDLCEGGGSGDVIWADGTSRLSKLKDLVKLDLSYTGVKRICRDWRQTMTTLRVLTLSHTNITQLTYAELQFNRKSNSIVELEGIPLENLQFDRIDYDASKTALRDAVTTVVINVALNCDCHQYWAARTLRDTATGVKLQGLRCGSTDFYEVDLEQLTCDAADLCVGVPANCSCQSRPDLESPGHTVRLACEKANLDEMPKLDRGPDHAWLLHLAHNRISHLQTSDLPPVLLEVDLRNNSISQIDDATAAALVGLRVRRTRIAGNPLVCGCSAHYALATLRGAGDRVDFSSATCDGKPLYVPKRCPLWEWIVGALLVGVGLSLLALAAMLLQSKAMIRVKMALVRAGWLPYRGGDTRLRFDAFVSYAHQDEEIVHAMASQLESGRKPMRLCLHERDWAPGGWIPSQISASVRLSRCTIAVLSEHYMQSGWARAEFREAHAAALRNAHHSLIVVLLDAPEKLPLDNELREYISANTYVRWGDPWFWEKLHVALRPPRTRANGEEATPASKCKGDAEDGA